MNEKLYTYNELLNIGNAVDALLVKSKNEKFNRRLIYTLSKNLRNIQTELDSLNEGIEDLPEEFNEYVTKLKEAALECGAKKINNQGGFDVNIQTPDFDKKLFDEKSEELEKEHKHLIDRVNDINKRNNEYKEERISDIKLYKLKLDTFPEELNLEDMPFVLIDLIEE